MLITLALVIAQLDFFHRKQLFLTHFHHALLLNLNNFQVPLQLAYGNAVAFASLGPAFELGPFLVFSVCI